MNQRRSLFMRILLLILIAMPIVSGRAEQSEQDFEAPGPLGVLKGTYSSTGSPTSPVMLIIPGSGPTDRDGNSPLGITASTYKYLAERLAEKGVRSIRIDKRGMFGSKLAIDDANDVTLTDYADDIDSWIKVAKKHTGVHCVWLLGHSEGGLVALVNAQRGGPVCGIVLAASPGRPFGELLRQQLHNNPANAPLLNDAMIAIQALEAGRLIDVTGFHPALQRLFAPQVQGFLSSLMSFDPALLIAKVSVPVLILQGESDLQITTNDALRLHNANPEARLVILPQTNHVLKQVKSADRKANLATYSNPSLPLAPGVTESIIKFMKPPKSHR